MEKNDKRILLFERERDVAPVIESILKDEGYEVETARTVEEVRQKTIQHDHDVLIVSKPAVRGPEGGALGRIDSSLRKILIARGPDVSDIFLFVDVGFDDYVALTGDPFCSSEGVNLVLAVRGLARGRGRSSPSERRREEILVFEEDSKQDLAKTFAEAGFMNVSKTADLKKALRIAEEKSPDLLAADFTFPPTVPLLKEARVNSQVRVLLVSEPHRDFPPENLFWFFDYFMVKPVRPTDLVAAAEFLCEEESCYRLPRIRARGPEEAGANFYLVGPYGAGKSTIARLLSDPDVIGPFRNLIPTLDPYPRYITRKLWPKEKEGVDYYPVTETTFDELCRRGKEIDWNGVDWGKKAEGIREFYPLEGIRVGADIPFPAGRDFLIAPALKGFEKMAPEDRRAHAIFFGISFETMKKRQLDRPESDRDRRTPKTLDEYNRYLALFDPYVPGRASPGGSNRRLNYGLLVINEEGREPGAHRENELNRMRRMAVRLAWHIKCVREGK